MTRYHQDGSCASGARYGCGGGNLRAADHGVEGIAQLSRFRDIAVEVIRAYPLAIVCESSGIPHMFYLSELQKDGVAVHMRSYGVTGTISLSRPAAVVGGDEKGSCGSKTLEEIRAAGLTVELPQQVFAGRANLP